MSCVKSLNMSGGCTLETCSEATQVPISGTPTLAPEFLTAFAPDLCYCLVCGWDAGTTTTYFFKYEPGSNTMTLKGSHAGASGNSPLVYDVAHQKFVLPMGPIVVIFDPVTETVSDFASGVTGAILALTYVEYGYNKIYGHMGQDGLGQMYVGYIDLDLLTVVQLGVCPSVGPANPFVYNFAYSPLADCLYGCWQTGISKGLFEFDLQINNGVHFFTGVPAWAQFFCVWDTDRELLICLGQAIKEVVVILASIVRTTLVDASLESLRWLPWYISSMKRIFAIGYDSIGDKVVGRYMTEAPYTGTMVKADYLYDGLVNLDEGSFFAVANTKPAGVNGWRRLCLTA